MRNNSAVVLFVEGGSLSFDRDGYASATGDCRPMLDGVFQDALAQGQRKLSSGIIGMDTLLGSFVWLGGNDGIPLGIGRRSLKSKKIRDCRLAELSSPQAVEDLVEKLGEDALQEGRPAAQV